MDWLKQSIIHTRGVARGQVGQTHELSEARQGTFHYTIGPYSQPVMQVAPGDRIVVDTRDAFDGKIQTEKDLPSQKLKVPFLNPQSGPIMIMHDDLPFICPSRVRLSLVASLPARHGCPTSCARN